MFQTHLPVDTSKRKRRLVFLLSAFLVAAVLVAALVFSFSTRGQTPTATSPLRTTLGSQNIAMASTPTPVSTRSQTSCPAAIENGSTGPLVISLQSKLNALYARKAFPNSPYHFSYPLAKDGIFGLQTENAVKDFQTKKRIGVDGIVGLITWHNLGAC